MNIGIHNIFRTIIERQIRKNAWEQQRVFSTQTATNAKKHRISSLNSQELDLKWTIRSR